jgi:pimeloyl-ACP methyl ester carboxylesterase
MREGWLERDGVRLHHLEWGAGSRRPPLLLLHGLSSNARFWTRLADLLPSGRRVVALDQRSHGGSDRPASGYSIEVMSGDAAWAIEELGLERPVVVGHSWGASVALDLAGTRPDLVSGLASIDGPIWPMSERLTWDEASRLMQPPLPRYASLEEALAEGRAGFREAWGDDLGAFVEAGLVRDGEAWVRTLSREVRLQILTASYGFHPELIWPRLEIPVTIILAKGNSVLDDWKESSAASVLGVSPGAEVLRYESPHDIPIHFPAQIANDLERLCRRAPWFGLAQAVMELEGDWGRSSGLEGWSAKDLLAHLSSSQAMLAGIISRPPPENGPGKGGEPFDGDRWNASQVRRRRESTPEDLRHELWAGTHALDQALHGADLGSEVWVGPQAGSSLGAYLDYMQAHQEEHLAELKRALAATP